MTTTPLQQLDPSKIAPDGPALTAIARDLANTIEGEVRFGRHDRLLYATDASIYQVEPLGVVIPSSIEDAARAVAFCAERRLPILPRGGGTSLVGQCVNRAVVLDFSARCTALLDLDETARRCRVEPGITIDDLNDAIRHTGLFFPPDPSTTRHANIGGAIGNNAAGAHSILYGRTTESLLGIDACLADGRRVTLSAGAAMRDPIAAELTNGIAEIVRPIAPLIRERFPRTVRRNAGYALDTLLSQLDAGDGGFEHVNLAHLICGSEGTLAVTLGAELALRPIPKARGLAVVAFDTLDAAIEALLPILDLKPAAVELLDDLIIDLARENLEHRRNVDLLPKPAAGSTVKAVLYVEFFSETGLDEIEAKFAALVRMFGDAAVGRHTDPKAMAGAWALRKAGEPLLHAIPGHRKPLGFIEDNAVPPERLAEFVRGLRAIVENEGTIASYYAHASVGVLHVRPLLDLKDTADRARMERIALATADLAKSLGGVMSGEHGDGRARGPLLERFYGPEIMRAFREVKALFDPNGLLNPGNIVDPQPIETIHDHTRVAPVGEIASIPQVDTYFDYSDQTDFAHAVEMCNGAGVCRKKTGGTMCPSYMATLDERHATRGRGNALRLAISGQSIGPGASTWNDPETRETLDLCLSCKACKAECPSNVDIARLKAEYTAQGYRSGNRISLQTRAFAAIHTLTAMAGMTPRLVNAINGFGPSRALINAVLGLHPKRSLPPFAKPLHKQWGSASADLPADAPVVVLYADTFTTYNEPHIGMAARRVLEAFGYRVCLHRGRDAARAAISVGLLDRAIRSADAECAQLGPIAADDSVRAILFLEPSVMSAVTDDWIDLKLTTPRATREAIASKSRLVEQFLGESWVEHPRTPGFHQPEGEVILHAHCHQKALYSAGSSAGVLERCFPGKVRTLDTSCCGLAGSFGYTKERFGLSMQVGELGVLPAARAATTGDILTAPGTSCRHQVHDGAGVKAMHPVEVLARML